MSSVADPTNVVGRRVVASLIDGVLVLGPSIAVLTSTFEYLEEDELEATPFGDADAYCDAYLEQFEDNVCIAVNDEAWFSDASEGFFGLALALTLAVYVVLQGLTGWTIGKLITGIRTVREDGRRPGIGRAFVRWVLWLVDGLPYFAPLVGFITALTTTGHRRVGDMVAKTFVVRSEAAGRPVLVPGVTGPLAPPPPGAPPAPPPTGSAAGPPAASSPAPAPASSSAPQWDEARGTYIQWDPQAAAWMQWDEQARRWDPIPGQAAAAPPPPPPPPP